MDDSEFRSYCREVIEEADEQMAGTPPHRVIASLARLAEAGNLSELTLSKMERGAERWARKWSDGEVS